MSRSFVAPSTPTAGWRKSVNVAAAAAAPAPVVLSDEMLSALPPKGIEDMITLEQLSEETILANLKRRFDNKLIYVRAPHNQPPPISCPRRAATGQSSTNS
jgi:NADPH:quinone reductase-like Zn-dependent oxidoreductase